VAHAVMSLPGEVNAVILDFKHVLTINESSSRVLYYLLRKFHGQGRQIVFTNVARVTLLRRYMRTKLKEQFAGLFREFEDNDAALEWCENRLLAAKLTDGTGDQTVPTAHYELFAELSSGEVAVVQPLLERRMFPRGEVIVQFGAPAGELFFLARGKVSVTVPQADGAQKRLATFSAGMAFGEMAMLDRAPRSAAVTADTEVECDLLKLDDFERLGQSHPHIHIALLRNLARGLSRKLRKANRESSVFNY
jgi:glutaminase